MKEQPTAKPCDSHTEMHADNGTWAGDVWQCRECGIRLRVAPAVETDDPRLPRFYTTTKCSQCGASKESIEAHGCPESCGRTAETPDAGRYPPKLAAGRTKTCEFCGCRTNAAMRQCCVAGMKSDSAPTVKTGESR